MYDVLEFRSKPYFFDIDNYMPYSFSWQDWEISDEYCSPVNHEHGKYVIIVRSHKIDKYCELAEIGYNGQRLVCLITKLMKYLTGMSLNVSERELNDFSKILILPGDCPNGWISNYDNVDDYLKSSNSGFNVKLKISNVKYCGLDMSPLNELEQSLKKISCLDCRIVDLMELYYHVDIIDSSARYMLLGKVLEIIDSIYPLKGHQDNRIKDFFPELSAEFGSTTIKSLMGVANTRKETRHYFNKKNNSTHPSLSMDEAKDYYSKINLLVINIIRKHLGLDLINKVEYV